MPGNRVAQADDPVLRHRRNGLEIFHLARLADWPVRAGTWLVRNGEKTVPYDSAGSGRTRKTSKTGSGIFSKILG
jgi:hypothetical protein